MSLTWGRVRTREELTTNQALPGARPSAPALPIASLAPKIVVDAALRAERIVRDAESSAGQIHEKAERMAAELQTRVRAEARAEAATALAAQVLAQAEREARADDRALERSIELGRLLAERLLGEALALDPARVVALAETALREARGARKIVLLAHPDDIPALENALSQGRLLHVTRLEANAERSRGALRMESELGVLDASLAPQLDRLAQCLKESLLP